MTLSFLCVPASVHICREHSLKLLTDESPFPHALMLSITNYLAGSMLSLALRYLHIMFPPLGALFCPASVTWLNASHPPVTV